MTNCTTPSARANQAINTMTVATVSRGHRERQAEDAAGNAPTRAAAHRLLHPGQRKLHASRQQHPQRNRNHDIQQGQRRIDEREDAERRTDDSLDEQQPPAIEHGPHAHRRADSDDAVHQRVGRNEGGQGHDGNAGPQQRERAEYDRGKTPQQEQPPVVADGGSDFIGEHIDLHMCGGSGTWSRVRPGGRPTKES